MKRVVENDVIESHQFCVPNNFGWFWDFKTLPVGRPGGTYRKNNRQKAPNHFV